MPSVKDLFERASNMKNGVEEARPIRMSGFYGVLLLTAGQIQTSLCRPCSLLDVFAVFAVLAVLAVLAGRAETVIKLPLHLVTCELLPRTYDRTQDPGLAVVQPTRKINTANIAYLA